MPNMKIIHSHKVRLPSGQTAYIELVQKDGGTARTHRFRLDDWRMNESLFNLIMQAEMLKLVGAVGGKFAKLSEQLGSLLDVLDEVDEVDLGDVDDDDADDEVDLGDDDDSHSLQVADGSTTSTTDDGDDDDDDNATFFANDDLDSLDGNKTLVIDGHEISVDDIRSATAELMKMQPEQLIEIARGDQELPTEPATAKKKTRVQKRKQANSRRRRRAQARNVQKRAKR